MVATLLEGQADLRRLVEVASRGEDVVILVEGKPKARLTRAGEANETRTAPDHPHDLAEWLKRLEILRRENSTGRNGAGVEQILAEDRADRV